LPRAERNLLHPSSRARALLTVISGATQHERSEWCVADPGSQRRSSQGQVVKQFVVYMLATRKDGPLYTGVTSDLRRRVFAHKTHAVPGFTARYNVDRLVWFEVHDNAESAIRKEKQLKRWHRAWKKELIETANPDWRDLYETLGPE
jgi:putative endonuclease